LRLNRIALLAIYVFVAGEIVGPTLQNDKMPALQSGVPHLIGSKKAADLFVPVDLALHTSLLQVFMVA
jgi:hypothetical protein